MNRGPFCVHFCLKDLEETEICCTLHGGIQNRSPVHTHHFVGGIVAYNLQNLEMTVFCCIFVVGIPEIVIKPYTQFVSFVSSSPGFCETKVCRRKPQNSIFQCGFQYRFQCRFQCRLFFCNRLIYRQITKSVQGNPFLLFFGSPKFISRSTKPYFSPCETISFAR